MPRKKPIPATLAGQSAQPGIQGPPWTQLAQTQEFQTQIPGRDTNHNTNLNTTTTSDNTNNKENKNKDIDILSLPVINTVPGVDQVGTVAVIMKSKFDEYYQVYKGLHFGGNANDNGKRVKSGKARKLMYKNLVNYYQNARFCSDLFVVWVKKDDGGQWTSFEADEAYWKNHDATVDALNNLETQMNTQMGHGQAYNSGILGQPPPTSRRKLNNGLVAAREEKEEV